LLTERYRNVRSTSLELISGLLPEDLCLQAMADTSPLKWHLAHTTWFFETFILKQESAEFSPFDETFEYLFNSYYNAVGKQYPRPQRHLLSRPTVDEVIEYRRHVDAEMVTLLDEMQPSESMVQLGLHHEQQHQELMLTDLKYNLYQHPFPVRFNANPIPTIEPIESSWHYFDSCQYNSGYQSSKGGFWFDNETPQHLTVLAPFAISSTLITNGDFMRFINAGGYENPDYWLSDGWSWVNENHIRAPLYWQKVDNAWRCFTLHGIQAIDLHAPVSHISFYEAAAYAAWSGCRLPTEFEWEYASQVLSETHSQKFTGQNVYHPVSVSSWFESVWQWTQSAYQPYPGFKVSAGAVGEYNGKFMCNQMVLKGGSCATSQGHTRSTYRNFFYPHQRWQFSGLRLAKST